MTFTTTVNSNKAIQIVVGSYRFTIQSIVTETYSQLT